MSDVLRAGDMSLAALSSPRTTLFPVSFTISLEYNTLKYCFLDSMYRTTLTPTMRMKATRMGRKIISIGMCSSSLDLVFKFSSWMRFAVEGEDPAEDEGSAEP